VDASPLVQMLVSELPQSEVTDDRKMRLRPVDEEAVSGCNWLIVAPETSEVIANMAFPVPQRGPVPNSPVIMGVQTPPVSCKMPSPTTASQTDPTPSLPTALTSYDSVAPTPVIEVKIWDHSRPFQCVTVPMVASRRKTSSGPLPHSPDPPGRPVTGVQDAPSQ
jgi:hypothetical protein